MIITLLGRVPSKKNSKRMITKTRYGVPLNRPMMLSSQSHEDWKLDASWQIKAMRLKCETPFHDCPIKITFYPPDRSKGDLTNKAESIMDLLVECRILEDDNWFEVGDLHLKFGGVDPKNPRAEILINETPNGQ